MNVCQETNVLILTHIHHFSFPFPVNLPLFGKYFCLVRKNIFPGREKNFLPHFPVFFCFYRAPVYINRYIPTFLFARYFLVFSIFMLYNIFFSLHYQAFWYIFHHFPKNYLEKVLLVQKKAVPLHPLSKRKYDKRSDL